MGVRDGTAGWASRMGVQSRVGVQHPLGIRKCETFIDSEASIVNQMAGDDGRGPTAHGFGDGLSQRLT